MDVTQKIDEINKVIEGKMIEATRKLSQEIAKEIKDDELTKEEITILSCYFKTKLDILFTIELHDYLDIIKGKN